MRAGFLIVVCFLAACSGGVDQRVADGPSAATVPPVVLATDVPAKVGELLAASETDSCGICVREKQEDAIGMAGKLFVPGALVEADPGHMLRRLAGGDMELYFGTAEETAPDITFRFHSRDENLVGIRPEDYSDQELVAAVLAAEPGAAVPVRLEVIRFEYGDAPAILFDAHLNRLQVQCKLVAWP